MLAVMSVLSERTKAEITAARELHARSAKVAGIVFAHRSLARRPQIPSRTFAFPSILEYSASIISSDVVLGVVMVVKLLLAGSSVATRISKTG